MCASRAAVASHRLAQCAVCSVQCVNSRTLRSIHLHVTGNARGTLWC